jgi:hypothetical protein
LIARLLRGASAWLITTLSLIARGESQPNAFPSSEGKVPTKEAEEVELSATTPHPALARPRIAQSSHCLAAARITRFASFLHPAYFRHRRRRGYGTFPAKAGKAFGWLVLQIELSRLKKRNHIDKMSFTRRRG